MNERILNSDTKQKVKIDMSSVDQNNSIMNKQGTVNKVNSSNFYMNTTGMNHTFSTNMKSNLAKKTISKSPIPTRKLESV